MGGGPRPAHPPPFGRVLPRRRWRRSADHRRPAGPRLPRDAAALPAPDAPGQESGGAGGLRLTPPVGEQPLPLEPQQLVVRDDPPGVLAASARSLYGPDAAQPAILPAGERLAADDPGEFFRRVILFLRLPLDQPGEQGLDAAQAFLDRFHRCSPLSVDAVISRASIPHSGAMPAALSKTVLGAPSELRYDNL